ncbi:hypothetical protein Tsubulata_027968 [Turnera subulata]|uniref:Viral late gene transcription factor 3 zinc ribbon domain-containing protein n=1 Tax=Turnera subulata TaxID=218843 RepID=A0A9Q0JD63_9ROSI|nr:hypothetical protein Tsubulata_027968 [Turnera subulata]
MAIAMTSSTLLLLASSPTTRSTANFHRATAAPPQFSKSAVNFGRIRKRELLRRRTIAAAMNDQVSAAADVGQVEVTWQIIVGALAGVTPFVVAGIEFSKRIIAQRRCEACGGSGLVLEEEEEYFRCPKCGAAQLRILCVLG